MFNGGVILESGCGIYGGDFSNATSFIDNGARWSTISNDLSLGSYEIDANIGLSGGSIYSGTFGGTVDCSDGNGNLWDGIFNGIVMDGGCIFGGTYNGDVTEVAANTGAIGSATFTGTLTFNTVSPQTISNSDISNITVTADGVEVDDMDGNTYTGTDFVTKNGGSFVGFGQGGGGDGPQLGDLCTTNADCSANGYYCGWSSDTTQQVCTDGSVGQYCQGNDGYGSECAPSNYCDMYNSSQCQAKETGTSCTSNTNCTVSPYLYCGYNDYLSDNKICTNGNGGQSCYNNSSCAPGNYCGWDDSDSYQLCTNGGLGQYCEDDGYGSECVPGLYCDTGNSSRCSHIPCSSNDGCTAYSPYSYCGYDGSGLDNQICTKGVTNKDHCNSGDQCADGYCDLSQNLCSTGADNLSDCDNTKDAGNQCQNDFCNSNDVCTSGGNLNDNCLTAGDCPNTGYCDTNDDYCTYGNVGDYCGSNADCASGFNSCANNYSQQCVVAKGLYADCSSN